MLQSLNPFLNRICRRAWWLYPAFIKYRTPHNQHLLVSEEKDLVIEGFPRSANSFVFTAFRVSQDKKLQIAHHLHHEAQLFLAAKFKIPTVVLIREPFEACISTAIFNNERSIMKALNAWIRFYKSVEQLHDKIVICDFKDVTFNINTLFNKINKKYKTKFKKVKMTSLRKKVFEKIKKYNIKNKFNKRQEFQIAIPNLKRNSMKKALTKKMLLNPQIKRKYAIAKNLYLRFKK